MDKAILHTYIDIFRDYVYKGNISDTIILSSDTVNPKYCDEHYKEKIYTDASGLLSSIDWTDISLSDKSVCDAVISAINKSGNLLFGSTRKVAIDFIEHHHADCAKTFRNLYGNRADDQQNFTDLCQHFGATYQLIAYLFFIKDKERYLPVSPKNFDRLFPLIGIDGQKMSRHCTWANYNWFIANVRTVQEEINEYLHLNKGLSLLTAHSIIWILGTLKQIPLEIEQTENADEPFKPPINKKSINLNSAKYNGSPRKRSASKERTVNIGSQRDRAISEAALMRANYQCECEINQTHPTFARQSDDNHYMEAHHLIPWAYQDLFKDYSLDNVGNIVCLCGNCHNQLHHGKKDDIEKMVKQLYKKKCAELEKANLFISEERLLLMY